MNANDYIIKPTGRKTEREDDVPVGGLTVRDHIAISSMDSVTALFLARLKEGENPGSIVEMCYERADEFIEKSNKCPPNKSA